MRNFSDTAKNVLKTRYLWKNEKGELIEGPRDMFERVANALFPNNKDLRNDLYDAMLDRQFLPNTPTLVNAGRENGQLSACFVLPIEDSMDGIFRTVHDAAIIHKTGGGTGFSFSRLRPKGARVNSTGGEASGVISFLRVFNEATESVKQGGVRRGANMGLLRVDHPEIMDFIKCKDDPTQLNNFNLSVGVTDKFMDAVYNCTMYDLIDPSTGKPAGELYAPDVWKAIVHQAWKNGEPGVIFLDEMNRHNPTPEIGTIESTNPCGEQPLLPYESCNLGSINLAECVDDDGTFLWTKLQWLVETGVHALNAVLDHNHFPLSEVEEMTLKTRKIGLGVMGFADALIKMGTPYNSNEAVDWAEAIMKFINDRAHQVSKQFKYKNATCTTIAPTGTIAMIADCSSGIEPNFSWVYTRRSMDQDLYVVHPLMKAELEKRGCLNDAMLEKLHKGTPLKDIPELADLADVWVLSHQIASEWHVKMQAAFQRHTDNAVSKTINLPSTATEQDISDIYMTAWKSALKGITVYRDGSRESQVLNFSKEKTEPVTPAAEKNEYRVRPRRLSGSTTLYKIGCGKLYVTVNHDDNGLFEVTVKNGKSGGCVAQTDGTTRMVSLALRSGVPVEAIVKQLRGVRCPNCTNRKGLDAISCPDAIGRAIAEEYAIQNGAQETEHAEEGPEAETEDEPEKTFCPECGAEMERRDGCITCTNCGYSPCSG